jgi:hypothetical protein
MKAATVLKSFEALPTSWSGTTTDRDVQMQTLDHPTSQEDAETQTASLDAEHEQAQPYRRWGINE